MQSSFTARISSLILIVISMFFLPTVAFSTTQQKPTGLEQSISIHFKNQPLWKILEKISEQTDVAILYDQELADEIVTGNYKSIKASDAITRLFREKNKSIQVNYEKKIIIVKTFGAKNFIWVHPNEEIWANKQESFHAVTFAELENLHGLQYQKYKDHISDKNEILEGGVTRGEITVMHEQQYKQYKDQLANDNELLEGGITRGDLLIIHEQQYKKYKIQLATDNKLLEGGRTRSDIRTMHKQQYSQYKKDVANNDEFLEHGLTLEKLRMMHKQQYNESLHLPSDTID